MAWSLPFLSRNSNAAVDPAAAALAEEQAALGARKTEALELARATAATENRAPNLTDYFHAAMGMPELQGNPRIISDLSGQKLDGFTLRREDIYPDQTTRNTMRDVIPEQPSHGGVREMRNFMDADGNGTVEVDGITDFYREVQTHMKFNGTDFHNVTFQPATTLEIFSHAAGANYANITLDGLGKGEVLTIGRKDAALGENRETFNNVHIINDQGGTIQVAGNATLNGLTVENGRTVIEIASGGQVNQLQVRGETVALNAQPNAQMFLPSFDNVNFTPDSSMQGAILRGNTMDDRFHGFRETNLQNMSFEQATLSGITFDRVNLDGAKFCDARRIADCVIKDTNIANVDFTGASVHNLIIERGGNAVRINSLEELQQYQRQEASINAAMNIGRSLKAAGSLSIENSAPAVEFKATEALVSNPEALPAPSATEPVKTEQAGDVTASVGTSIARFPVKNADQNDVTTADQTALSSSEALALRTQIAMESFQRGSGRDI